jgi:hypothetical protein
MQIKDLSVELAAEAMTAVHGGGNFTQSNTAAQTVVGPVQVGPIASLVGASSNTSLMATSLDQTNFGLNSEINDQDDFAQVVGSLGVIVGQ